MTDPNWFFSTMAQSTAALLGLLGGLLVSRLMDYKNSEPLAKAQYRVSVDVAAWRTNAFAHVTNWRMRHTILRGDPAGATTMAKALDALLEDDPKFRSWRGLSSVATSGKNVLCGIGRDDAEPLITHFEDGQRVAEAWRQYERLRYPLSFYFLFAALLGLGGVGLIWPMYYLAGFNGRLYSAFIVGFALLSVAVALLLHDLASARRIEPGQGDPNYRTRRPRAEG